jgi:nicotinamide riboside transporter PnuC
VEIAVVKQQTREQWLVAVLMAVVGVVLIAVVVIELMKRSPSNSP